MTGKASKKTSLKPPEVLEGDHQKSPPAILMGKQVAAFSKKVRSELQKKFGVNPEDVKIDVNFQIRGLK